ncbi:ATP-binding protein [Gallionella capsiferriformans]|uniref:Virulence sensor protein BvgS n=1 Tax=Gallionella capsiferriformans (strain ES-2) TaxID=395494 RepID=D9SFN7_GALCS|nr:ATP-binding protein [Gallionella capsiferriformans]ADL55334.1 multi-sensor hybrid histidine kinase [Gallionella capsiferriformans ES-2]
MKNDNPVVNEKSLYRELTISLALLVSLVSIAVSLLNYAYSSREADVMLASKISAYTDNLRESLEWPLWNVDDELISKIGRAFVANAEIAELTIRDDQQRVIYQHRHRDGRLILREFSVEHEGKYIGSVEISLSLRAFEEKNHWLLLTSLGTAALLIISLLGAMRWMLARLLKKPVDNLVGAIAQVVEGRYPLIALAQTYTEFAPIISGFKTMSDAVASREASLRASEQKMLSILEGVDAYIYLKDTEGHYLFANRPLRELWQVEMNDLIGFGDEKFFNAESVVTLRQTDSRVLRGGETLHSEEVNTIAATGKTVYYQSTKLPLYREDGSIYALCGISVDITERKRIEEALRVNEERLKLATRAGGIGIWDWDVAANVLTWDDSMYLLYGLCAGDFGGAYDAWLSTLHPDDRALSDAEIQAALRGEREFSPEFRVIRPDGEIRKIKAFAKVYRDESGSPTRMVGTNFDITDLKRIEEELRKYKDHLEEEVQSRTSELVLARNAAETANLAKSVFLANMSHELRTPLNAVLGFSSLLRKDPLLSKEQRTNLNIINRSGEYLLALINDVLEMAKIEAGWVQLDSAPLDLGMLVRDVTDMMQVRAQEKGLQLLIDQSSEFPRYIRGDEARLRQILINLVGNAVKFTQQGGVTVRFGLKPNTTPAHLLIEVEDTGSGIAAEDQEKIFEPFVQVGEVAMQKGTGLGLTITRQFVQLMGGSVTLNSKPGSGSLFRVELPINMVRAQDMIEAKSTLQGEIIGIKPGQPAYRILIVEDQQENQLLLRQLMERLGLPVKVASDGVEALELFNSWHPDLIWMDRRMPVMDGIEAARRIRALPGGEATKIIAVTASAFMEQRTEMLAAGMNDFVRKPYRFNEIYDALSMQLGLQYVYADTPDASVSEVVLTDEMLMGLPEMLRSELNDALESLEVDRINHAILQVPDEALRETLTALVANFDYPVILKLLQASAV